MEEYENYEMFEEKQEYIDPPNPDDYFQDFPEFPETEPMPEMPKTEKETTKTEEIQTTKKERTETQQQKIEQQKETKKKEKEKKEKQETTQALFNTTPSTTFSTVGYEETQNNEGLTFEFELTNEVLTIIMLVEVIIIAYLYHKIRKLQKEVKEQFKIITNMQKYRNNDVYLPKAYKDELAEMESIDTTNLNV